MQTNFKEPRPINRKVNHMLHQPIQQHRSVAHSTSKVTRMEVDDPEIDQPNAENDIKFKNFHLFKKLHI